MSGAIAIDTHRFVENLTSNGFTKEQAEALAHEHVYLLTTHLVTKTDLAVVQSNLEVKVEKVKSDLLKWMVGALTAHLAVVAALVQYL